jgi:hypothetical protein
MKGVVFTEFFDFVEQQHSPIFLQQVINQSDLESNGAYTATGTYPTCEMGELVTKLAESTGSDPSTLLFLFGQHLLRYFVTSSPQYFDACDSAFDLLTTIESHIHVDVKKLYPDAELPTFQVIEHTPTRFVINYTSVRGLGDLCEGLIKATFDHYGETAKISRVPIAETPTTIIQFILEM